MRVDVDRMIAADQSGDVLASDPPDLLVSDVRGTALFTGWNRVASKVILGDTFGRASDHFTVAVGGPRRNVPRLIAEIPSARIASWLTPLNNDVRSIAVADASNALVLAMHTSSFDRASGDSSTAQSMTPDWTVTVTAVADPAVDEIKAGLERERLLRVALAGALLLASVLLARATSRSE